MAQSSPEGIVLGKGSTLVSAEVSINEEKVLDGLTMGQILENEKTIEEPKPFKNMLPLTKVDWEKFKKNPIPSKKEEPKQETTSEGFHRISKEFDYSEFDFVSFKIGTEWQQEQFSKSEFIQLVRATKSDAEARRIIREYFK